MIQKGAVGSGKFLKVEPIGYVDWQTKEVYSCHQINLYSILVSFLFLFNYFLLGHSKELEMAFGDELVGKARPRKALRAMKKM